MSYTYLTKNSIISELSNYRRLPLGETEKLFVVRFAICSPYSAYEAYTDMKNIKPMSYKNVHNKIRRLVALGLLQKEKGKFKRNAIKYKLTTRGLFERLLMSRPPVQLEVFRRYHDNIILQKIVYKYFEDETIEKFAENDRNLIYITSYVAKCCEEILKTIEHYRQEGHPDLDDVAIYGIILREAVNMIFVIALLSNKTLEGPDEPNGKTLVPIPALANDENFMTYLYAIKDELDLGYYKLASMSKIPKVRASAEVLVEAGMLDVTGKPLAFKRAD